MAKDTFYFSHDYNARNDIKIKKLISKHGFIGYGIYWALIEDLYNNTNVLHLDYDCISYDLRVEKNLVESIINDFDLFQIDGDFFSSLSVERRLEQRNERSLKARESVLKRWNKNKPDTNVLPLNNECNTIKEKKGKENKENNISLTLENDFTVFWDKYNKKVDSKKCKDKFFKLKDSERAKILEVVESYVFSTPDLQYRKNPLTWLNGKCWEDVEISIHIPTVNRPFGKTNQI